MAAVVYLSAMALNIKTVSMRPPSGILDTRSEPADIADGAFRWKLNFSINDSGKMCRRRGYGRLMDQSDYGNLDLHDQTTDREPITMIYENTWPDGERVLIAAASSWIAFLDEDSMAWTRIANNKGNSDKTSRFKAASLQDYIVFTNDNDDIFKFKKGDSAVSVIDELKNTRKVAKARVVVQFNGIIMLMNVVQDENADGSNRAGGRQASRIVWGDLNDVNKWAIDPDATLCGFQDLDYGDEILAAAPMLGSLYIYTTRSIWRCTVSPSETQTFAFQKIYSEPKNQKGCLLYGNSLVGTGRAHYYMGRDGIYVYNPYLESPERVQWIHNASGWLYQNLNKNCCANPIAEYSPEADEIYFSFPTGGTCKNDYTLALNIRHETADYMDAGFSALCNFRRTPTDSSVSCNETQLMVAASTFDLCLKQFLADGYYREHADIEAVDWENLPTANLSSEPAYLKSGYGGIIRGGIPTGLLDREKIATHILIDVTAEGGDDAYFTLRTGTSYHAADSNAPDSESCAVVWRGGHEKKQIGCVDSRSSAKLAAQNLRLNDGTEWEIYEQGRFLHYEISVVNSKGNPPTGGKCSISRIDFKVGALLPV